MNRRFFPVAIAMLSSEKNEMIVAFFTALQNCARFFGINVSCHFIMIDAAPEEALAIRKAWPLAIILMCWFHVKKNIKEPKNGGHLDLKPVYDDIISAINSSNFKSSSSILLINGLLDHSITGKYLIRLLVIRVLKTLKNHSTVK